MRLQNTPQAAHMGEHTFSRGATGHMGEHMFSHVNPFYMGKLSQPTMGKLLRQFQAVLWILRGGFATIFR